MRRRSGSSLIRFLLWAVVSASVGGVGFAGKTLPPVTPGLVPDITLSLDAVSPFTSTSRPAPASLDVPQDVTITFRATSPVAPSTFTWTGATLQTQDGSSSVANQVFRKSGTYTVQITATLIDASL